MWVQVPTEDTSDVLREPQSVKHREQIEQGSVHRIREPWFDGYGVIGVGSVRWRRVIQNEYGREIHRDHFKVLGVTAIVHGAMLSVIAPLQHPFLIVKLVRDSCSVNLHAGCKNY